MKKKRLVYVEEIEKGKVNTELLKDIVDGDKIENEILFSTTEEINIDFKLFIISNHMLRFNTDPGIARRLICMEFNSRFAEPDEYEKEKEEFKDRNVFVKDKDINTNIDKNDEYKNAFANLIIEYAMQFYEKGLNVPAKFEKASKELCDENDKMKQFLNDNFDITKNDDDRISKKEFHEMYINATGLKLTDWSGLLSDIKRLNLQYDSCKKRVVYNGKSEHGVILGIKKKHQSKEDDSNEIDFVDDCDTQHGSACERTVLTKAEVESIKLENLQLKMKLETMQLEMEELKNKLTKSKQSEITTSYIEDEIDILDEINEVAVVKTLSKSTSKDKSKKYKSFKEN
jgi:hypothetical protein